MAPRVTRRTMGPAAAWTSLVLLALSLAAFGLVGCAKRINSVDSSFRVEGEPSPSQLVVFPDTPTIGMLFRDTLESGPSLGDYIIDTPAFYTTGPGTIRGMIFDFTQASDFQIFRQESNGGFLKIKDFPVRDTKQWVDSHTDLFQFVDQSPLSLTGVYLGRGIVDGVVNQHSPLTNLGSPTTSPIGEIDYQGDPTPDDSLFTIAWSAVPGAAGYYLQVYQFRSDLRLLQDRILAGAPAPIYADKATDLFVGFMPAGVTSYKLGDPVPAGGRVFFRRQTLFNFFYFVRVSAVGPSGELLAYTGASGDFILQQFADQTYLLYPIGGVNVAPVRPEGPAPAMRATSSHRLPADFAARHPRSRVFTPDELTAASGR